MRRDYRQRTEYVMNRKTTGSTPTPLNPNMAGERHQGSWNATTHGDGKVSTWAIMVPWLVVLAHFVWLTRGKWSS
jgi:hypothetical protein